MAAAAKALAAEKLSELPRAVELTMTKQLPAVAVARNTRTDKGALDKNCNSLRLRKIMRQSMTTDPESSMVRVSEGVKARLNSGEWYVACGTDGIEPLENEQREHCLVEAETFVCYVVKKD
ncbi:hypothetical protein ANCDUO_16980 [Ancylostoma duodenale]|uniref:Ground-like domain protein n=1 Tax=Ancylostoma duodenale TaxID=51022 RepID=A0A0C2G1Z1_9BILA|nr:hypothetical protein ANCDUO_16980 [Ancylostoma duodenale]